MRKAIVVIAVVSLLGALAVLGVGVATGSGLSAAGTKSVTIEDNSYSPHKFAVHKGTIVKWTWDFGDGQKATVTSGAEQIHRYVDFGSYQVTLTVEDSQGPVKEYTREVIVQPPHRRATR